MINFVKIRADLAEIVDRFHQEAHDLIARIEGQVGQDAQVIGQQIGDDVHAAEAGAQQASQTDASDVPTSEQPPPSGQPASN